MENHGYHDIIGSSAAPYINSLASGFASATAWSDVSHPSLPNYLALTAGSFFSNPQDCVPTDSTPEGDCTFDTTAANLADQLTGAGISWKAYIEDLPRTCDIPDNFTGNYDVNHNPFMYYDNVVKNPAECNNDVPYTQLATDLANNALPSFVWVTPNLIDDMHDGTIQNGDNFLRGLIPTIQASTWYAQGGVILVTWDEGETEEQIALIAVSNKNAGKGAFHRPRQPLRRSPRDRGGVRSAALAERSQRVERRYQAASAVSQSDRRAGRDGWGGTAVRTAASSAHPSL